MKTAWKNLVEQVKSYFQLYVLLQLLKSTGYIENVFSRTEAEALGSQS